MAVVHIWESKERPRNTTLLPAFDGFGRLVTQLSIRGEISDTEFLRIVYLYCVQQSLNIGGHRLHAGKTLFRSLNPKANFRFSGNNFNQRA